MTKDKAAETSPVDSLPETPITVLQTTKVACLVQWFEDGRERRCTLPATVLAGDTLPASVLAQGAPYGVPWAEVLTINVTAERLEAALHGAGLWTPADVQAHPDRALGALQAAYGIDLGALLEAAARYPKEA